mgnify:CR=1 FL=1
MNVNEAIEYIHSVCWKGSIPGLGRTQELLRKMGNPEKKLKFVHIAGSNGKGSTATMCESVLRHAGYKTGLMTTVAYGVNKLSPELDHMTTSDAFTLFLVALPMWLLFEVSILIVRK